MKSFVLVFSLISFLGLPSFAKDTGDLELNQIRATLAKYKKVEGQFKQTRFVKDLKLSLESDGNFVFKAPLDLTWAQKNPFVMDIFMTSEKILQKNADGTQQEINKEQQPVVFAISSSFLGVLLGDEAVIKKDFKYKITRTGKKWMMDLEPNNEIVKKIITSVKIEGADVVEKVEITEKTGNTTKIVFSKVKGS